MSSDDVDDLEEEDITNEGDEEKAVAHATAAAQKQEETNETDGKTTNAITNKVKEDETEDNNEETNKRDKKKQNSSKSGNFLFCCSGDTLAVKKNPWSSSSQDVTKRTRTSEEQYASLQYFSGEWTNLPEEVAKKVVSALLLVPSTLPRYELGYLKAPDFEPIRKAEDDEDEDEEDGEEGSTDVGNEKETPSGGAPDTGEDDADKSNPEETEGAEKSVEPTTTVYFEIMVTSDFADNEEAVQRTLYEHTKEKCNDITNLFNSFTVKKSPRSLVEEIWAAYGVVITKEDVEDLSSFNFLKDEENDDVVLMRLSNKEILVSMLKNWIAMTEMEQTEKKHSFLWYEDALRDKRLSGEGASSSIFALNAEAKKIHQKDEVDELEEKEVFCIHFRYLIEAFALCQSATKLSSRQVAARVTKFSRRSFEPNWIGAEQAEILKEQRLFVPESHMRKIRRAFLASIDDVRQDEEEKSDVENLNPSIDKANFIHLMRMNAKVWEGSLTDHLESLFDEWFHTPSPENKMDLKSFYKFYACIRTGSDRIKSRTAETSQVLNIFCEILKKVDPGPREEPGYAAEMDTEEIRMLKQHFVNAKPKPFRFFIEEKEAHEKKEIARIQKFTDNQNEEITENSSLVDKRTEEELDELVVGKTVFFELIKTLSDEGTIGEYPPLREQSQLYLEADQNKDGCISFEELANLYVKIRDGTLPKAAGTVARMSAFLTKKGILSKKTRNWDNETMEERYRSKYGETYIFEGEAEDEIPKILKTFEEAAGEDQIMDKDECVTLLQSLFDAKTRYNCAGEGGIPTDWGPSLTHPEKLARAFERKNRRPDIPGGQVAVGDFFELFVECHMRKYDDFWKKAKRPKTSENQPTEEETAKSEESEEKLEEKEERDDVEEIVENEASVDKDLKTENDSIDREKNESKPSDGEELKEEEEEEGGGGGAEEEVAEETLDSEPEPQVTLGSQPEPQTESNLEDIQNAPEEKSAELVLEPEEEILEQRILPLTLLLGNESKIKKRQLEHCKCSYDGTTLSLHLPASTPAVPGVSSEIKVPTWARAPSNDLKPCRPPSMIDMIREIRSTEGLTTLVLDFNNMTSRNIQSLGRSLRSSGNSGLERLSLKACGLSTLEVSAVMDLLEGQPHIMELNLSNNMIGSNGLTRIANGLKSVKRDFNLNLSANKILSNGSNDKNVKGFIDLLVALKAMPGRKKVMLNSCGLGSSRSSDIIISTIEKELKESDANINLKILMNNWNAAERSRLQILACVTQSPPLPQRAPAELG